MPKTIALRGGLLTLTLTNTVDTTQYTETFILEILTLCTYPVDTMNATLILPSGAKPLEMVPIPRGTFLMGSPESESDRDSDESPQHQVTVPDFLMGRYTVTQAQWFAVMGSDYNANGWQERWNSLESKFKGDNLPIVNVSWDDAQEFVRRLSQQTGRTYRLPTEAEWEYACRAGTTTPFSYGETITPEVANYDRQQTTPVGSFPANPWELYDMHGNVWEWCQDSWYEYQKDPVDSDNRLLRGGSFSDSARLCRSACRVHSASDDCFNDSGFRVCVEHRENSEEDVPPTGKIVEFFGNHAEGYDRIPDEYNDNDKLQDCFRSDCTYALSPYWDGSVECFVPDGCDFSVHPPVIVKGFKILNVIIHTEHRG